jgi:hypothetical protein
VKPSTKSFLTAAILLVRVSLWAQEVYHPETPDLLARLSYDSNSAGSVIREGEGLRQVCVAVSRDGDYRIMRWLNSGRKQRLQGKIQEQQLEQLRKLISDSDFRDLLGSHGGLIRQSAESFGAEIPREDGTQHLQWLNGDGESPFPGSVTRVVNWLKHFEPTDGKPLVSTDYSDVCPSGGLRLLHPSVAGNLRPEDSR